jgi:uncharacterized protein (DUF302 family)
MIPQILRINARRVVLSLAFTVIIQGAAYAQITDREGWIVLQTRHSYQNLISRVEEAARDNQIGIVTRASATIGAKEVLEQNIPGNIVIGLYHPRFAVRMLEASLASGIEAPIRVYVTENEDGTATLSYKEPSFVFGPYMDEGGEELRDLAAELDELFQSLAEQAAGE